MKLYFCKDTYNEEYLVYADDDLVEICNPLSAAKQYAEQLKKQNPESEVRIVSDRKTVWYCREK